MQDPEEFCLCLSPTATTTTTTTAAAAARVPCGSTHHQRVHTSLSQRVRPLRNILQNAVMQAPTKSVEVLPLSPTATTTANAAGITKQVKILLCFMEAFL